MKYFTIISLLFTFLFIEQTKAQPDFPYNPNDAKVISSDIKNFIEAFDALSSDIDSVTVLQKYYFDRGSEGLKEYQRRFNLTAESLNEAIQKNPENYYKLKGFYNNISSFELSHIKEMEVYKKVLSNAIFPPTYLLVGDYLGYANGSRFGQLVTVERAVGNVEKLKNVIIHELTHFQQAMSMGIDKYSGVYSKKDNMLELILREGAAEFVTYKLVKKNVNQFEKLKKYEKKEIEYWERFKSDIKNQNKTIWLTGSSSNNKDDPSFLGYSLGYKIIESYYKKSSNKEEALNDILKMENVDEFFKKSGYVPKN